MKAIGLVLSSFLLACGGTSTDTSPDAQGTIDGAGSGSSTCKTKATSGIGSGHHNAGLDCMGGCHNHGFTAAGTLFSGTSSAIAGATIEITDASGKVTDLVTQQNGNFYTSTSFAFPIRIEATECPSLTHMLNPVTATQGCNSSACHGGSQGRIHLP